MYNYMYVIGNCVISNTFFACRMHRALSLLGDSSFVASYTLGVCASPHHGPNVHDSSHTPSLGANCSAYQVPVSRALWGSIKISISVIVHWIP